MKLLAQMQVPAPAGNNPAPAVEQATEDGLAELFVFLIIIIWGAFKTAGGVINPNQPRDIWGAMLFPSWRQFGPWLGAALVLFVLYLLVGIGVVGLVWFLVRVWPDLEGWPDWLMTLGGFWTCYYVIDGLFHNHCKLRAMVPPAAVTAAGSSAGLAAAQPSSSPTPQPRPAVDKRLPE